MIHAFSLDYFSGYILLIKPEDSFNPISSRQFFIQMPWVMGQKTCEQPGVFQDTALHGGNFVRGLFSIFSVQPLSFFLLLFFSTSSHCFLTALSAVSLLESRKRRYIKAINVRRKSFIRLYPKHGNLVFRLHVTRHFERIHLSQPLLSLAQSSGAV